MKRNFVVGLFGSFIGCGMLLIVLGTAGIVGARSVDARPDRSQVAAISVSTPLTSTFTYQGQLKNNGNPITDTCDFQFGLWDSPSDGTQIGITQTLTEVSVNAGYFTTLVNSGNPFGVDAFNGNQRWLAITVRCPTGSGGYTAFNQRQQLTAVPYALHSAAPWVSNGSNLTYNAGNVGIGLNDPGSKLTAAGVIQSTSGGYKFPDGTTQTTAVSSGAFVNKAGDTMTGLLNLPLDGLTVGTNALVVKGPGRVGIGTNAPVQTLQVNGITSLGAPGGVYGYLYDTGGGGLYPTIGFNTFGAPNYLAGVAGYGGLWQFKNSDGSLVYYTGSNVGAVQAHANTPRFTINKDGDVGIGTPPNGNATLSVQSNQFGGIRVLQPNGNVAFHVSENGLVFIRDLTIAASTTHVCSFGGYLGTCSSAAEYVPTIDSGSGFPDTADLVSIAPNVTNPYGDTHGPFVVTKSVKPCDDNLLGFIVNPESGADGKKLNEHYLPLAIYGYFPAKVTLENGAIRRGDALTSSSKAGYAMKATQACKIIGYALEDADHEGTLQVFANHGENAAPAVTSLQAQVQELKDQNATLNARLNALEQTLGKQTQAPSLPAPLDKRGTP